MKRIVRNKAKGPIALVIVGIYTGLWGCAPSSVEILSPTSSVLASQIPLSTPTMETTTTQPEPSLITPTESSSTPTENGIDATQAQVILPLQPAEVITVSMQGEIRIDWTGTGEDLIHYQLFRRRSTSDEWIALVQIEARGDNLALNHYIDQKVEPGVEYIYGIAAVNTLGAISLITESDPITAK